MITVHLFFSTITVLGTTLFISGCDTTLESCVYRDIGVFCAIEASCVGVPILDECMAFCSGMRSLVSPGITLEPAVELADLETAWWYWYAAGVELVVLGKGMVAAGGAGGGGKLPFIDVMILELSGIALLASDAVESVLAGIPAIL